jgi:hypothetical protein
MFSILWKKFQSHPETAPILTEIVSNYRIVSTFRLGLLTVCRAGIKKPPRVGAVLDEISNLA